ncbi:MAG TPA: MBL fold metallo-hydrolase [Acidimicrobiales bacterium]
MEARVWGCRGSVATPGPDTVRYGGNTSCVEVRLADDSVVVLDAGTGIRPLGIELESEAVDEIHLLLSHLHLDHLQGLGFFRPLFNPSVRVHIWGPPSPVESLEQRIAQYLSPPLFPVRLADIPAEITFHDAPDEPVTIGSAEMIASLVTHQGPTVGYRIEESGRSIAYMPDHEPSLGVDLAELSPSWISGNMLAHGVDVLFHDAQYADEEYPDHVGWGHSSISQVVEFARKAQVDHLVLFHHDPHHDDDHLDALARVATDLMAGGCRLLSLAREGMRLTVGATSAASASSPASPASPSSPASAASPDGP